MCIYVSRTPVAVWLAAALLNVLEGVDDGPLYGQGQSRTIAQSHKGWGNINGQEDLLLESSSYYRPSPTPVRGQQTQRNAHTGQASPRRWAIEYDTSELELRYSVVAAPDAPEEAFGRNERSQSPAIRREP